MSFESSGPARERRGAAVRAWGLESGVVLIASGLPVPIEGTDQFHDYHAHGEYRYLAGIATRGSVLAFNPAEGWSLFAPVASREDRVWTGDTEPPESLGDRAGIGDARPLAELGAWLEPHRGERLAIIGHPDLRRSPELYGLEPWHAFEAERDDGMAVRLSQMVSELRRAKDAWELDLMMRAAEATRAGHLLALQTARAGMSERGLQIELEAEFLRSGGDRTAYGSIVASGPNAATLHFAPTDRLLSAGDLVLIDAGAECGGYASDVTRTFPLSSTYTGAQRDLYALVLDVQMGAIASAVAGKEYRELHLEAAGAVAEGLVQLGLLRGDPASLVERDVHALFFPHGLGHLLGLATHDAGGCLAGREPSDRFGLKWLRADLPLVPGYVVTVEPGIYFIPALIEDPDIRSRFADAVEWRAVDELAGLGGIRIEDDVLITEEGPRVLTADIPKSIEAMESLRREALG